MATLNCKAKAPRTHEGALAAHITPEQQLRRSLMSCLLWESEFYEDGQEIAQRLSDLVAKADPVETTLAMIEARRDMHLRHAPLLIAAELCRRKGLKAQSLDAIIQRADELTEFLAIYWRKGKCKLSNQAKKGLALAFPKFDSYQLAKYNQGDKIKLRDVLFLCHAKPKDESQSETWKQLVQGTLPVADTWEMNLSGGHDKKETWERLLQERKLGGLALLRNLRNMGDANVNRDLIRDSIRGMKTDRILPFRFIAAARHAPHWESEIENVMLKTIAEQPKLRGKTVVLVDVSASMANSLSSKSDMVRMDAACGVAICAREMSETVAAYSFSDRCVRVPDRHGFALRDAVMGSQGHNWTYLGRAIGEINGREQYDRIIVVTDEQSHDDVSAPNGRGYMINVASARNGVGYGNWTHIDGFSESVLRYIAEYEAL